VITIFRNRCHVGVGRNAYYGHRNCIPRARADDGRLSIDTGSTNNKFDLTFGQLGINDSDGTDGAFEAQAASKQQSGANTIAALFITLLLHTYS
jgi:hypothetical protein